MICCPRSGTIQALASSILVAQDSLLERFLDLLARGVPMSNSSTSRGAFGHSWPLTTARLLVACIPLCAIACQERIEPRSANAGTPSAPEPADESLGISAVDWRILPKKTITSAV